MYNYEVPKPKSIKVYCEEGIPKHQDAFIGTPIEEGLKKCYGISQLKTGYL